MRIILANGIELNPIMVTGAKKTIQGATRDTLTFVFSASENMIDLDEMFSIENCETITIIDGEEEYIHKGYTVRAELSKKSVEVVPATETNDAVYEDRITIAMSQRTYIESQLASLTDTVDVLVMDSLMALV